MGRLFFVNDAYRPLPWQGKEGAPWGLYIPDIESEDRTTAHQCIQSLDLNNPVQTFECRIHHSCGQVRWNLWIVRALFDENQKPIEYQAIGKDNTEKREAATRITSISGIWNSSPGKRRSFLSYSWRRYFSGNRSGYSELLPHAVICVNSYDPLSDTVTVRAVFSDHDHELLNTCLGKEFVGVSVPDTYNTCTTQDACLGRTDERKSIHTDESIYNLFFQMFPLISATRSRKPQPGGQTLWYRTCPARYSLW